MLCKITAMFDKLIYILAFSTLLVFFIYMYVKGNTPQNFVIFILTLLPFMDLRVMKEVNGGFKVFHVLCYYGLIFLFKDFTQINSKNKTNFYFLLSAFLICIIFLGGLNSEFPSTIYYRIFKIIPIFIFARFVVTTCFKDPTFFKQIIHALKVSYVVALVFMACQLIFGLKFTWYPDLAGNTLDSEYSIIRYPSYFFDSQGSGQYFSMGSFLFLGIDQITSAKAKRINIFLFICGALSIYLAGSRSALGGFVVASIFVFALAGNKYRIVGLLMAIAFYALTVITSLNFGMFKRANNLSSDYKFRHWIWERTYEICKKHPYLGIGYDNYQDYTKRHLQDQYLETLADGELLYFDQPENGYLKLLVEFGYGGFFIFALFILIPALTGLFHFFSSHINNQVVFLVGAILGWLVAFNTVYSFGDLRLMIMVTSIICLIIYIPFANKAHEVATEEEMQANYAF